MGAWIETLRTVDISLDNDVAPLVGAWIETYSVRVVSAAVWSHPSWVRGLKQEGGAGPTALTLSHPSWVRGLKRVLVPRVIGVLDVAPLVGAWIETTACADCCTAGWSHPSWVRGLKLEQQEKGTEEYYVAPLVGAWIETNGNVYATANDVVAPLVGAWIETRHQPGRYSPRNVAPLVGAWIETENLRISSFCHSSRTPRGCVD